MSRLLLSVGTAALLIGAAQAQQSRLPDPNQAGAEVEVKYAYRASQLMGLDVRNSKGEELGEINDIVFDLDDGRIRYAAISFGGFLGVGDKLFAVPLNVMKFKQEPEEAYFVFDVTKERLEHAPGFNQDAWPDVASRKWRDEIDAYYNQQQAGAAGANAHTGTVVRATSDRLVMDGDGGQHAHVVPATVVVTIDGKPAKLVDLKPGQAITVTTAERNGAMVVTAIKAQTLRR